MPTGQAIILVEQIEPHICQVRGQNVILDRDLAALYGVETKRLNEQVRRNFDRFPDDFVFQLTLEEVESLRSQNAISKPGHDGQWQESIEFAEHGRQYSEPTRIVGLSVFVRRRQKVATHSYRFVSDSRREPVLLSRLSL